MGIYASVAGDYKLGRRISRHQYFFNQLTCCFYQPITNAYRCTPLIDSPKFLTFMSDLVTKYFHDTTDNKNRFNPPATDEQIVALENKLQIELPGDYKEFLKQTNGFAGLINEFVVDFDPVDRIYQSTQDTCADFFPWAVYIGTNGNLEMFVIDKRKTPFQFGLLPYIATDNDFIPLSDSFENFIERLYNDTAFDKV